MGPSSEGGTSTARSSLRRWPMFTTAGAGRPAPVRKCATSSIGFCVADSPMRVGLIRQQVKPLQRKRQMRAALVVGDGMNLVDDHRLDVAENRAAAVGGQQDVQRLGRGDQDVRRTLQHLAPLFHQRVAGADGGANLRHQQAAFAGQRQDFAQRTFEILLDVVAQRLQRRDVENFGAVAQRASRAPCAPGDQCRSERLRAFCLSRWEPRSAWCGRRESPASLAPAARWACQSGR